MRRAVQGLHAAIDSVARKVESAVDNVRSRATSTAETVQEGATQLLDAEEALLESVRTTVRKHPLLALGAAFAAGVLLSRLISSR